MSQTLHYTRICTDVKPKKPDEKKRVYQFAYINRETQGLIRCDKKMTYNEALAAISATGIANSYASTMKSEHGGYWGIYTHD